MSFDSPGDISGDVHDGIEACYGLTGSMCANRPTESNQFQTVSIDTGFDLGSVDAMWPATAALTMCQSWQVASSGYLEPDLWM